LRFLNSVRMFFLCPFKGRLDLLTNRQGAMLSAAKEFPGLTVLRLFFFVLVGLLTQAGPSQDVCPFIGLLNYTGMY
jgi:hypothetical protein